MPIGEFGRPPGLPSEVSPALTTPMYWMYEMGKASLNPARAMADLTKLMIENPLNPFANTEFGKSIAASCELFERTTRRYGKPEWNLPTTEVNGMRAAARAADGTEGAATRAPRPATPPPGARPAPPQWRWRAGVGASRARR